MNLDDYEKLKDYVLRNHIDYAWSVLGTFALPASDLKTLGVKEEKETSLYDKTYYFGMLSASMPFDEAKKLRPKDVSKLPLTKQEKESLKFIKQRTYQHTLNQGEGIFKDISRTIDTKIDEDTFKGRLSDVVRRDRSVKQAIGDLGRETGAWERDLGRLVETEFHTALQMGRLATFKGKKIYKDVYSQACRYCIKFYTSNGIGSEPILFDDDKLRANGVDNVGRKPRDWKPVVGATHPFCRCNLRAYQEGTEWSDEKRSFIFM